MGDGGRCKAVLYVLMHVDSGGPRLPVEKKQRAVHPFVRLLGSLSVERPGFSLSQDVEPEIYTGLPPSSSY